MDINKDQLLVSPALRFYFTIGEHERKVTKRYERDTKTSAGIPILVSFINVRNRAFS